MNGLAFITEIFSSIQGEGPHAGEPMTFVRFAGCSISCVWCDTKAPAGCSLYRVETPPRSRNFINAENPVSAGKLNEHLEFFNDETIAVTGGEPLEQAGFLAEWLPTAAKTGRKILLETNGINSDALALVARHVDIISMDIKLPSSAGNQPLWKEHTAFLSTSLQHGKETYVKIVISENTTDKDIQEAIRIITSVNKFVPLVLQPASETEKFRAKPKDSQIESFARLCHLWLPNVSVMRQMHKEMDIL